MTGKILISACLMGLPVRYNGSARPLLHEAVARWKEEGRLVTFCPELAGGFSVPRPAAEIARAMDGNAVLDGTARVVEQSGRDVSDGFVEGARRALEIAQANGCRHALLIDGSPSCGSGFLYDGSFSGKRHAGEGVTAALLRRHGIAVFSDREVDRLAAVLAMDDAASE
ncbi:uncharacterized protein YbbK (DUF523 family) [Rhizobium azooxidifex]|uniref:Uncharacterized protein YbbK (DUF523 family) n=1 Tax=Mycoplana azooxidifex TaxID=1636188 RepID=A0A7W6D7T5_9HYPH|nr:DUF523 domain-containing protein [Mycoplana azooxidifex]MBB3975825.1 uncharacterized protein YbbK (DUF523 family) [Mycoplana azooxidifex]